MNIADLSKPFDPEVVHWRVGPKNGTMTKPLAYIDARDVMQRLDDVCGAENWQRRYTHVTENKCVCEVGIRIDGEWVWKADGAGDTDIEANKGALSDAFKRAAVNWGIGQYLYGIDSPWINLEGGKIPDLALARLKQSLTNKGNKVQSPRTAAKKWAQDAIKEIHSLDTPAELIHWEIDNKKITDKLEREYPALHSDIEAAKKEFAEFQQQKESA